MKSPVFLPGTRNSEFNLHSDTLVSGPLINASESQAQINVDSVRMQEFVHMQHGTNSMRVPCSMTPQQTHQHYFTTLASRSEQPTYGDYSSNFQSLNNNQECSNIPKSVDLSEPPRTFHPPSCGYLTLAHVEGLLRVPMCPPSIRFNDSPFYKIINVIIPPTVLTPTEFNFTPGKRSYHRLLNFRISSDQAETITYHSRRLDDSRREFGVQVIMRFGKLEAPILSDLSVSMSGTSLSTPTTTSSIPSFTDSMPIHLFVQVNGRPAALPPLLPTSRPNMDGRRHARPVHITPLLRVSPSTSNHVKLIWTHDYSTYSYNFFAIYLVQKHSTKELCDALRRHAYQHAPVTQKQIVDKLASNVNVGIDEGNGEIGDDDDDLQIQNTLPVQLLCPLSKCRISLPVRGRMCQHIQCYDANTYLLINERKPAWKCPVCDCIAPFHELLVDGLLMDILTTKESIDVEEIVFNENGSWSPVGVGVNRKSPDPPTSPSAAGISSPSSSICHRSANFLKRRASPTTAPLSASSMCNEAAGGAGVTIDLTESDDEPDPTSKRQTLSPPVSFRASLEASQSQKSLSPQHTATTTYYHPQEHLTSAPDRQIVYAHSTSPRPRFETKPVAHGFRNASQASELSSHSATPTPHAPRSLCHANGVTVTRSLMPTPLMRTPPSAGLVAPPTAITGLTTNELLQKIVSLYQQYTPQQIAGVLAAIQINEQRNLYLQRSQLPPPKAAHQNSVSFPPSTQVPTPYSHVPSLVQANSLSFSRPASSFSRTPPASLLSHLNHGPQPSSASSCLTPAAFTNALHSGCSRGSSRSPPPAHSNYPLSPTRQGDPRHPEIDDLPPLRSTWPTNHFM